MDTLELYNAFYNDYCSGTTHGMAVTMEELQAAALESMVLALTSGDHAKNTKVIKTSEIIELAGKLRSQGDQYLAKIGRNPALTAQGVNGTESSTL
jgi:hypothetical protein